MIYVLIKKTDAYFLQYGDEIIASTENQKNLFKLNYSEIEELIQNSFAVKKSKLYSDNYIAQNHYLKGYLDCQEENIHKEFSLWDMLKLAECVWNSEVIDMISFKNYIATNYVKQNQWVVDIAMKKNETPETKNGYITIKKIK